MNRASEDQLAGLHGLVSENIRQLLQSDDPRERSEGINAGMKFLRDNAITCTIDASPDLNAIEKLIPSHEELEKLMHLSPE